MQFVDVRICLKALGVIIAGVALTACSPNSPFKSSGNSSSSEKSGPSFPTVGDALSADAGGDSSGGGNAVRSPVTGKFVLLDYMASAPETYLNFVNQPGQPLVYSNKAGDWEIAPYPFTTLPYQGAVQKLFSERIHAWWDTAPLCFETLHNSGVLWAYFGVPNILREAEFLFPTSFSI
jgi:hypothetical protein